MSPDVVPSDTSVPHAHGSAGQFALFAGVAFGPIAVLYALDYWAAVDSLRYERDIAVDPLRAVGLVALLLVATIATYLLWRRAQDRLVRGIMLLLVYEILLLSAILFLNFYVFTDPLLSDWEGHPFVPTLGIAAAMLFYVQALVFPLVVVVTMIVGSRVLAAPVHVRRKMSFGAILLTVAAAVFPPAAVAVTHMRFVQPITGRPWRTEALGYAADDIGRAMERYAAAHAGLYPPRGISWEAGDSTSMGYWFQPYADGWHRDSSNTTVGHLPNNPFTGRRYRVGLDFFYFPDRLENAGANRRFSTEQGYVPFAGMKAPKGRPGTIAILGYTPHTTDPWPTEYALVVYHRDVSEPWHNSRRYHYEDYMVLYGPKTDSAAGGK